MLVERDGERVRVVLEMAEVKMLRRALERASFIDTPMSEQAEIGRASCRERVWIPV